MSTKHKMSNKEILDKWRSDQENYYYVIVDGNNHQDIHPVKIAKGAITLKRCQDIAQNIKYHFPGSEIKKLTINMNIYDYNSICAEDVEDIIYGDIGVKCLLKKDLVYDVLKNCLTIWEDGQPIYENYNGVVNNDRVALIDNM